MIAYEHDTAYCCFANTNILVQSMHSEVCAQLRRRLAAAVSPPERWTLMAMCTAQSEAEQASHSERSMRSASLAQVPTRAQVRDMTGTGEVTKRRVREGRGEFPVDCPLEDCAVRVHFRVRRPGSQQVAPVAQLLYRTGSILPCEWVGPAMFGELPLNELVCEVHHMTRSVRIAPRQFYP